MATCNCGYKGATRLEASPVEGKVAKERFVWVCGGCHYPKKGAAEVYIKRCSDCLDEFSNPWSEICEKCYRIANSEVELKEGRIVLTPHEDAAPYRDWPWAAERERERLAQLHTRHLELEKRARESAKT